MGSVFETPPVGRRLSTLSDFLAADTDRDGVVSQREFLKYTGGARLANEVMGTTPRARLSAKYDERSRYEAPTMTGGRSKGPPPALSMTVVKDLSLPEGSVVEGGSNVVKRWRLRNSGTGAWPEMGVTVEHVAGDFLGSTQVSLDGLLPPGGLAPGQEVSVAIDVAVPPEPGRYAAQYMLRHGAGVAADLVSRPRRTPSSTTTAHKGGEGTLFGQRLWVLIQVPGSATKAKAMVSSSSPPGRVPGSLHAALVNAEKPSPSRTTPAAAGAEAAMMARLGALLEGAVGESGRTAERRAAEAVQAETRRVQAEWDASFGAMVHRAESVEREAESLRAALSARDAEMAEMEAAARARSLRDEERVAYLEASLRAANEEREAMARRFGTELQTATEGVRRQAEREVVEREVLQRELAVAVSRAKALEAEVASERELRRQEAEVSGARSATREAGLRRSLAEAEEQGSARVGQLQRELLGAREHLLALEEEVGRARGEMDRAVDGSYSSSARHAQEAEELRSMCEKMVGELRDANVQLREEREAAARARREAEDLEDLVAGLQKRCEAKDAEIEELKRGVAQTEERVKEEEVAEFTSPEKIEEEEEEEVTEFTSPEEMARLEAEAREASAVAIQCRWRAFRARAAFVAAKDGATVISAAWRAHVTREEYLKKQRAAVKIQAHVRRCQAANLVLARKAERAHETALLTVQRDKSATKVQSAWRMFSAKVGFFEARDSATRIQAASRAYVARKAYLAKKAAATRIQSFWRMAGAQVAFGNAKDAATKIQAAVRGHAARREYLAQRAAATAVASAWKMYGARVAFMNAKAAATTIEKAVRAQQLWIREQQAKAEHEARKEAATVIQAAVRGSQVRSNFVAQRKAAVTIQAGVRGRKAREEYERQREAAAIIQAHIRGYQARSAYAQKKDAAAVIQAHIRGYQVRKEYGSQRNAAMVIQAHVRGRKDRQEYLSQRDAAARIQAHVRGHQTRGALPRLRKEAEEARASRTISGHVHGWSAAGREGGHRTTTTPRKGAAESSRAVVEHHASLQPPSPRTPQQRYGGGGGVTADDVARAARTVEKHAGNRSAVRDAEEAARVVQSHIRGHAIRKNFIGLMDQVKKEEDDERAKQMNPDLWSDDSDANET